MSNRRRWWLSISKTEAGECCLFPEKPTAVMENWEDVPVIEEPTDGEIESAVRVGIEFWAEDSTPRVGPAIRHAIRHLLGRNQEEAR